MRVLLDTCTFLWIVLDPARLSPKAARIFADPGDICFLSSVSAWEIGVKWAAGRLSLQLAPELLVPTQREIHGILSLPLSEAEATYVPNLPTPHKDPFDRMLICQAIVQDLVLLTPDPAIRQYPVVRTDW